MWRLTPYQNATRWLVLAKHCAPLNASVYSGNTAIGSVVWQSAASDLELVRVAPVTNQRYVWCQAHHSGTGICNPFLQYSPLANNQVFMLSGGRERRLAVTGWSNAPDEAFCTSGWSTGVRCVWLGMTLGPGNLRPNYDHISAAHSYEANSLDAGDSGGAVLTYDRNLIGIISGRNSGDASILHYTPMAQVLQELYSYNLAPTNVAAAVGEDNPLPPDDENAGWELAPADDDDGNDGTGQTQHIGG
ncbi:S1 family peptidase [Xanthomonas axonopodis]|uniref:S1 family peptidase n=2 Tax=Xanthomonas axonopodis TaxID=53413 RepID=UPI001FD6D4FD|nr:S1 family peptidase [Xanthomonas axonopodis]